MTNAAILVSILMVVSMAHIVSLQHTYEDPKDNPTSYHSDCSDPSAPLPSRGVPDELPAGWGVMSVSPPTNRSVEAEYPEVVGSHQVYFTRSGHWLHYQAFTFMAEEDANEFFVDASEGASELHWDPGLGRESVAWVDSQTEFHVLVAEHQAIVYLVEMREDKEVGPWPYVAIPTASEWLIHFNESNC